MPGAVYQIRYDAAEEDYQQRQHTGFEQFIQQLYAGGVVGKNLGVLLAIRLGNSLAEIQPAHAPVEILPAIVLKDLEIVRYLGIVLLVQPIGDVFRGALFKNIEAGQHGSL